MQYHPSGRGGVPHSGKELTSVHPPPNESAVQALYAQHVAISHSRLDDLLHVFQSKFKIGEYLVVLLSSEPSTAIKVVPVPVQYVPCLHQFTDEHRIYSGVLKERNGRGNIHILGKIRLDMLDRH